MAVPRIRRVIEPLYLVRKVVVDTGNDALATALCVCATLVGSWVWP